MKPSVVVIGPGVDELVAAHTLARAGHDVTLVRNRDHAPDGALQPGWIPPGVVRNLGLEACGLEVSRVEPWAIVMPEDTGLELGADMAASVESIRRLSPRDAQAWPAFCRRMHALACVLESMYAQPPPQPLASTRRGLIDLARTGLRIRRAGRQAVYDLLRLLPMSVADLLDDWFESDMLKGALGGGGVMHLKQGARCGGTAFNLLHHHVGSPAGVFRPPLSNLHAALERRSGLTKVAGTVERIDVRAGRARSVVLANGDELPAQAVVAGEPPHRTLLEFVDAGWLEPQLVRAIRNVRSRGAAAQIRLTLDRDPRFTRLVVAPSLDYLERAYDDVKYGGVSREPHIEAVNLGAVGPQRYRVEIHVQYVPYALRDGVWDTGQSEKLARAVLGRVSQEVPGLPGWVIDQRVMTPADLDHIHGFPEGQPYHAELALDQILWMRPVPELAQYRTPVDGLYLCGPAMHPGGGIAGAAGSNAAAIVLEDLRRA